MTCRFEVDQWKTLYLSYSRYDSKVSDDKFRCGIEFRGNQPGRQRKHLSQRQREERNVQVNSLGQLCSNDLAVKYFVDLPGGASPARPTARSTSHRAPKEAALDPTQETFFTITGLAVGMRVS